MRTLANITRWPPARIEALRQLLRGHFDEHMPEQTPLRQGKAIGALFVLRALSSRLGIEKALGKREEGKRALFLVMARELIQGSRLASVRWAGEQAVEEVLGLEPFDEDDLYQTLDWLCAHQERIENRLFRYRYGSNEIPQLFLYDVTSSYLEGEQNELADWGYNLERKKGKKQVVIGLLTDPRGDPVAVEVFRGNTQDVSTFASQVRKLAGRFGIREVTLVGDRGMIKTAGVKELAQHGFHYITAITKPQIETLLQAGVIQMGLFDQEVVEVEMEGVRYVLRRNPLRAQEMARSRADKLRKLKERAARLSEKLALRPRCKVATALKELYDLAERLKVSQWVRVEAQGRGVVVRGDEVALEQVSRLDGCYVIKTDLKREMASTQVVHDRYKDLAQVEQAFRTMKTSLLEIRPIYVRKEKRTRGHVLVTMLAYLLTREVERLLKAHFGTTEDDPYAPTKRDAFRSLDRLCIQEQEISGVKVRRVPLPDEHQAEFLKAFDVSLPQWLVTPRM